MVMQTMIFILPLSGKKMMALPRQEDVDVAEAHTEVATVVTVATIIMGNVEDIEEATVTVEDTEEAIVEDTVEVTAEAIEATSEASEVVNEEESVVWICPYLVIVLIWQCLGGYRGRGGGEWRGHDGERGRGRGRGRGDRGGSILLEWYHFSLTEVFFFQVVTVMDRLRILQLLQFLHDCLTAQSITYPKTREPLASISFTLAPSF